MSTTVVELYYGSSWHAITSDVLWRDGLTVTRGRTSDTEPMPPTRLDLSLKNTTGKYSPRNPESALYGLIGRNTPIRVYETVSQTVSEDFEDETYAVDVTFGSWARSSAQAHAGSWSATRSGSGDFGITFSVPPGATTASFWYRGDGLGLHTMSVVVDDETVSSGTTLTNTTFTQVTSIDVTDASTLTIRHVAFAAREMWVDDLVFDVTRDFRFSGEVESWPQRRDHTGQDAWVPVSAYGLLRRLGGAGTQAAAPPAIYRYVLAQTPTAYWPMQDGASSSSAIAATDATTPLEVVVSSATAGAARWAGGELAPWLPQGLSIEGTTTAMQGHLPVPVTSDVAVDILTRGFSAKGNSAGLIIATLMDPTQTAYYQIVGTWNSGSPTLTLQRTGSVTVDTASSAEAAAAWDDQLHHWRLRATEDGSDVDLEVWLDGVSILSGTHSTANVNSLTEVLFGASLADKRTFGHAIVWADGNIPSVTDVYDAMFGFPGETVAERLTRLCTEEDITLTVNGSTATTLGPQKPLPLLQLLTEAADADGGILVDSRHTLGLTYTSHLELYDAAVGDNDVATLDFDEKEVATPFDPTEDTEAVRNDVTVERVDGGFFRAEKTTGTLNVQEPSDDAQGVGRYAVTFTLPLEDDAQTVQQAYWRRHVGTWDEARYPAVAVDLSALAAAGKDTLAGNVTDLDVASLLQVDNPPSNVGPDSIAVLVQGYLETYEAGGHRRIGFSGSPARPYRVLHLDDETYGRLDTGGCTLAEDLDSTETAVDVTNSGAAWSTTAEPYDITVNGETMTVTAAGAPSGGSQTLTVTRSVNGVTRTHTTGDTVRLAVPARLARR